MKISNLRLVEIELFSYCNRICRWCPNSFIDRKSDNVVLDDKILMNLFKELKDEGFEGVISLSRYNEPFSKPEIINKFLNLKNIYLKNNKVVCNTNGDFDFSHFKDKIEITEMDYDLNKEEKIYEDFRIMRLKNINNRAGALDFNKSYKRNTPCFEPMFFVGINYDGTVSPCCNIRNDVEIHKEHIMGDLKKDSLTNILNYEKNIKFRELVSKGMPDLFPETCKSCSKMGGRYTSGNGIIGEQS